jgi:alanine racemase
MSERFFEKQPTPAEIRTQMEGFPSWFEINLDHIEHNLKKIRERVGVEVMPVVKNNAYGHGLIPMVAFLEQQDVNWVMVAKTREALEIKDHGFTAEVLNMDVLFTPQQYEMIVEKDITQTIYTLEAAEKLSRAAEKLGKTAQLFLKVDTGLNRVGVNHQRAPTFIEEINSLPYLKIMGIFSTFMQHPERDEEMLQKLMNVAEEASNRGIDIPYRSMASSDAIFHKPESWLDMVRPGITLYGVYPEEEDMGSPLKLRQALSMKARLEYIKTVEEGESVTYFGRYITPERMPVGTIHAGFYDGIPREMANKGTILVKGEYRPSIGSVSLNHYIVDIRGVEAEKGDIATIIGEEGPNNLHNTAKTAGWMVYSLLNHLNPKTPRVYLREGEPIALIK